MLDLLRRINAASAFGVVFVIFASLMAPVSYAQRAPVSFAAPSNSANKIVREDAATMKAVRLPHGAKYGDLPLSFEANRGQVDSQVDFVSRGSGYHLFLTPSEAVLSLTNRAGSESRKVSLARGKSVKADSIKASNTVVRLQFVGADSRARAVGSAKLEGTSNYFIGGDPKGWRTGIPNYAGVKYEAIYPGIDLVYYGNQGQLEYDFIVAPGSDARAIKLVMKGANKIVLDSAGDLVLHTATGQLRQHKPFIYQEGRDGRRKQIAGRYTLEGENQIGFQIGVYDHTKPLVIDPVLVYSTYLSGSGADEGASIAVDAAGNAYITGTSDSIDFPRTTGASQTARSGGKDAFVIKLNPAGTAPIYSTYLGGSLDDEAYGIAIDAAGNAYVAGTTASTNFPATTGAFQTANGGGSDSFVAKLNSTGANLVYATYLGGSNYEEGFGIASDSNNNAYITGVTASPNFTLTSGAPGNGFGGAVDAFVTKLNADGTAPVYSTFLGGAGGDLGFAVAVDAAGNAHVTGLTDSSSFPVTSNILPRAVGTSDLFVTKLNSSGTSHLYSSVIGGGGDDTGLGITMDGAGVVYVTGITNSTDLPVTAGVFQNVSGGGSDAFVMKMNTDGTAPAYSTYFGGAGDDLGYAVAVDSSGNAFVTGTTDSINFQTTTGASQTARGGGKDAFVSKLNASGALVYSTYLGGSLDEESFGIALDGSGHAYVTGRTRSPNFPVTTGSFQTTSGGGGDAFVAKVRETNPAGTSSIIGHVRTADGAPLATASVTLSGTRQATTLTNAQGVYAFDGLDPQGVYVVAVRSRGLIFSPASRSFNAGGQSATLNFTSLPKRKQRTLRGGR